MQQQVEQRIEAERRHEISRSEQQRHTEAMSTLKVKHRQQQDEVLKQLDEAQSALR